MKTRVISAAVVIVLLIAILIAGRLAICMAVFALALISMYEYNKAMEKCCYKPVYTAGFAACLIIPALTLQRLSNINELTGEKSWVLRFLLPGVFLLFLALCSVVIFFFGKYKFVDISVTLFGIAYIVFPLSLFVLTINQDAGHLYVWMILLGAYATDTFAYFVGVSVGKTKILPTVSPNKSLEGFIGGFIGCTLVLFIFGWYFNSQLHANLYHFAVLGGLCGLISQLGDWMASAIKRTAGIKDFGNIMPGHGGALDRIDSILFTAPLVYFYINLFF